MPKITQAEFAEANNLLAKLNQEPIAEATAEMAYVNSKAIQNYYESLIAINEKHQNAAQREIEELSKKTMINIVPVPITIEVLEAAKAYKYMYPILGKIFKIEE